MHSNSGRAERENTRRNAGHVSERRARGEARGEIRNETSCFDEGVAAGGVQCTRNEAYAYGGVNVLGRREEKREVETGVLGVVRNEAYGLCLLGRKEERCDVDSEARGLVRNKAHHVGMSGRREERSEVEREGFGVATNEAYGVGMLGRGEGRREVESEELSVARNEAYGLMCEARKKVMTVVYEDTEEP